MSDAKVVINTRHLVMDDGTLTDDAVAKGTENTCYERVAWEGRGLARRGHGHGYEPVAVVFVVELEGPTWPEKDARVSLVRVGFKFRVTRPAAPTAMDHSHDR